MYEKIILQHVDLTDQKITKPIEYFIELTHDHLLFSAEFYADEPVNAEDKLQGWKNVFNSFEIMALKKQIAGIEKSFLPKQNRWGVYIFTSGFPDDIKLLFRHRSEARELFNKLKSWLLE